MPRKGQGQKIQTATGQQYGQAAEQEEAQRAMPLPKVVTPSPGEAGAFTRPTERPNEPIMTPGPGLPPRVVSQQTNEAVAALTPLLEMVASQPFASEETKKIVRQIRFSNSNPGLQ
ncbi:MAG: hypothetical protein CMM27_14590 [Rhodospirillaceae bacterium]|nr:hypothetical protein [Rhodospirillaceae bacterium]|tara:strand:- start:10526 stop:10873 length:348 start_codon:yes stop_codon:yes gene_type:complete